MAGRSGNPGGQRKMVPRGRPPRYGGEDGPEGRVRALPLGNGSVGGGAARTRPDLCRMMSASDRRQTGFRNSLDDGHCRRLAPRIPARTRLQKEQSNPPQARFGVQPAHPPWGKCRSEGRPGGWLGPRPCKQEANWQRNHDGHRLPSSETARYGKHREAFPQPGPKRSRSIRQREHNDDAISCEGVEKNGVVLLHECRDTAVSRYSGQEFFCVLPTRTASHHPRFRSALDWGAIICQKRGGTRPPLVIERGRAVD